MDQQEYETYEGIFVPASALRREQRRAKYGTLADLPDEELADPDELERVVYKEMWWPILRLPQQPWECPIRPNIDEDGRVDWGAFGTVDFERYRPPRSKLLYKAERLKAEQMDLVIRFEIMGERIQGSDKYKVLKPVRLGLLATDDIENVALGQWAKLYLRILRLQRQRYELIQRHRRQQEKAFQAFWRSMGC